MSIGIWKHRHKLAKMRHHEPYRYIRLIKSWNVPTLKGNRPAAVDWIINRDGYRSYQ